MADIFVTEEITDNAATNSDSSEPQPPVQIVIEAADEPQQQLNECSQSVAEPENSSDMTLKEGEPESDQFVTDGLLVNPDDLLPPIVKLEKYAKSEVSYNRQTVIRNLLDILRAVQGDPDHVSRIVTLMATLSEDYDHIVRTELMGQFPQIAAFFKEKGSNLDNLWQILINSLGTDYQVRKAAHTTLLSVVEDNLIDIETVTQKICPLIVHLTDSVHPEELRINSIMLISKLAVLLGKDITEGLFLPCIFTLCEDKVLNIRKTCALAFGDICTTVGREATEEYLLPRFITLCMDNAWSVRKACAENFMPVSCVVSRETRCNELAEIYKTFLVDQSRWVRITAYQGLGPFISTFAEPEKTGLYYSKDGILTIDIPKSPEVDKDKACDKKLGDFNENNASHKVKREAVISCDSIKYNQCPNDLSIFSKVQCDERCVPEPNLKPNHFGLDFESVALNEVEKRTTVCTSSEMHCDSEVPSNLCNDFSKHENLVPDEQCCDNKKSEKTAEVEELCGTDKMVYLKMFNMLTKGENTYFACAEMHNASEVPGIPCHVGNFCSSVGESAAADIEVDDAINEIPQLNGRLCFAEDSDSDSELMNEHAVISEINEQAFNNSTSTNDCDSSIHHIKTKDLENISKPVDVDCSNNSCSQTLVNGDISVLSVYGINGWFSHNTKEAASLSSNVAQHSQETKCVINGKTGSELTCIDPKTNSIYMDNVLGKEVKPVEDSGNRVKLEEYSDMESSTEIIEDSAFNHFQYWRPPFEDIDIKIINTDDVTNKRCRTRSFNLGFSELKQSTRQLLEGNKSQVDKISENKDGEPPPSSDNSVEGSEPLFSSYDQDIVPASLLDYYLGMMDTWAEVAHHCAYSLPAVAFTLGRKNWPCLRETFNELSCDISKNYIMMWKIRRTVAFSMHQLAVILGPEITTKDLIPVFSKFIYDLDEVRIGILQHISEFLKLLRPEERKRFLPCLSEFLQPNSDSESSEKNWRFRLIFAEQLVPVADLYEPLDVRVHLVPLALTLIQDKICEVRLASVRVLAAVFRRMSQHPTNKLTKEVLTDITEQFIHSPKWIHRQLYVYMCQEFITEKSLPPEQFAEDVLPHLLYLCWDRVPNIRIATARCLASVIWPLEAFSGPESPYRELLLQAIHTLQGDSDADVQFYAYMVSTHECSCLVHDVFTNLPV